MHAIARTLAVRRHFPSACPLSIVAWLEKNLQILNNIIELNERMAAELLGTVVGKRGRQRLHMRLPRTSGGSWAARLNSVNTL